MECKFCKNTFTNISSLNKHIKYASYCISKRTEKTENSLKFICDGCDKNFTSKYSLKMHIEICHLYTEKKYTLQLEEKDKKIKELKEEKDKQIKELKQEKDKQIGELKEKHEKQIKELQDKLENIAVKAVSRPTTSNKTQINNFIQQLEPVTEEKLKESVSNLTIDHIKKGAEGYAQYALDYPLKDKMVCVDFSRRKIKFKDKDGNVITDPEMTGLALKFFNSIKEKNKELICLYA
ncbi:MAG: C2H2-type zinc finger protein, partial [Pseudomonadota bacterium]